MIASVKSLETLRIVRDRDWQADGAGRDAASCQFAEWIKYNACDSSDIDFEHTTRIDLSGLALWFFPDLLNHFPRLQALDLADNLLMFVPPTVAQLSTPRSPASLVELNLSKNPLESLPEDFRSLGLLQRLDLSNTRVQLPELFSSLPASLEYLNLKGVSFSRIPDLRDLLPRLAAVDCDWQEYAQLSALKPASPTHFAQGTDVCSFTSFASMSSRQSSNTREQDKT